MSSKLNRVRNYGDALQRVARLATRGEKLEQIASWLEQLDGSAGAPPVALKPAEPAEPAPVVAPPYAGAFPPGHFYSPIPSVEEIKARHGELFPKTKPELLPGIDLNLDGQLALLEQFKPFRAEMPFGDKQAPELRSVFSNTMYCGTEGALLYFMMRHLQPKRIIEVGSGYSTCFMLDTNRLFMGDRVDITLVEPYPDRLRSLLKPEDSDRFRLLTQQLQDVPLSTFASLEANDILFIDSTHVSKLGSDVNYLLFQILPALKPGVFIHIHDIFYPFEYPADWIEKGFFWNEAYALRAFLQYNSAFRIAFFHDQLLTQRREQLLADFPVLSWGQNIWLQKVA